MMVGMSRRSLNLTNGDGTAFYVFVQFPVPKILLPSGIHVLMD
jgi:hypothetical protein